jgi:hypothetical protein
MGLGESGLKVKAGVWPNEVRYIQRRASEHDARFITVGELALFSTNTGDAWLLDPADRLAARLARDGDPEAIFIEETEANFTIGWKGRYRIDGTIFVYTDRDSGRVLSILGYPTAQTLNCDDRKISNIFG